CVKYSRPACGTTFIPLASPSTAAGLLIRSRPPRPTSGSGICGEAKSMAAANTSKRSHLICSSSDSLCDEFAVASEPPPTSGRAPHDLLLAPGQHILRCDVARGAVQPVVVVVVHVILHQASGIIERQRRSRPDALPFERLCQRSIFPFDCG